MRIGAKILKNLVDINHWQHASQAHVVEGQANDIYLQLIDLDWSTKSAPEQSPLVAQYPIRYISPATTITVSAQFQNIDTALAFSITATQPFANDKSIFKLTLTSIQIPAAGNLIITVIEDTVSKSFVLPQAVFVELLNRGGI